MTAPMHWSYIPPLFTCRDCKHAVCDWDVFSANEPVYKCDLHDFTMTYEDSIDHICRNFTKPVEEETDG